MQKRIAIVKLTSMGDVALAAFVPQLIKQFALKDCSIDWFCDLDFASVIQDNPFIDTIYPFAIRQLKRSKKGFLPIFSQLRLAKLNNYDMIIDLQGTLKSAIVSRLIKAKSSVIYGFSFKSAKEGIASVFYNKKHKIKYDQNIVRRNLELACFAIGIDYANFNASLDGLLPCLYQVDLPQNFLQAKEVISLAKIQLGVRDVILLNPFASKTSKNIPINLIESLVHKSYDKLFVCHFYNEQQKIMLSPLLAKSNCIMLPKPLSIKDLKALIINNIDASVGADSGINHFASLCGKKSLTVFFNDLGERNILKSHINLHCKPDEIEKTFSKLFK